MVFRLIAVAVLLSSRLAGAASTSQPIIAGTPSGDADNAVVLLVAFNQQQALSRTCTATLVAPNLVLTARHCVAAVSAGTYACAPDGTVAEGPGGTVMADRAPADLYVMPPGSALPTVTPAILATAPRGVRLFVPDDPDVCAGDLALLELDRELAAPTVALRLDRPPARGESFAAIGWGVTDSGPGLPAQRQRRDGVVTTRVGPKTQPGLAASEFEAGESTCHGDSGGPAIAGNGAVIGVAARGGNGTVDPANPARDCTDPGYRGTWTHLSAHRALIENAFSEAGFVPLLDPAPPADASGCAIARASRGPRWPGPVALALALALALGLLIGRNRRPALP